MLEEGIRIWVETSHIMKLLESVLIPLSAGYENEFSWNYRKSVVPEINQYISIPCNEVNLNLPLFSTYGMQEKIIGNLFLESNGEFPKIMGTPSYWVFIQGVLE